MTSYDRTEIDFVTALALCVFHTQSPDDKTITHENEPMFRIKINSRIGKFTNNCRHDNEQSLKSSCEKHRNDHKKCPRNCDSTSKPVKMTKKSNQSTKKIKQIIPIERVESNKNPGACAKHKRWKKKCHLDCPMRKENRRK